MRKETENKKSGRSKRNDRKDTSQILFMGISSPEIRKLILSGTLHERNSLARIHKNVCGRKHEQGIPKRTIAKRAGISLQKVRKILITAGAWSDETSEKIGKMRSSGMSVPEIAEEMGMKTNTVWSYLPYSKGMYNQEYPTINAIRVRNSKRKAKEKALTCTDTAQNEGSGAC